jgi:putative membrane protein
MLSRLRLTTWAAPALLLIAAACQQRQDQPSGVNPTSPTPANDPARTGAPGDRMATPPANTSPGTATAPGATASPTTNPAAAPPATGSPAAPSAELGGPLTDGQIAAITDGLHSGEIEQAKVARSKSKNKQVQSFANMMIEHHGQAKKQQAALKETPEPSPLATQLQSDGQQTLTKLNQASGADFDRAYLEAQVEGHQKALDTLKLRLLPNAKDAELTKYLRGLEPKIEQHLTRARTLRDSIAKNDSTQGPRVNQPASVKERTSASPPADH